MELTEKCSVYPQLNIHAKEVCTVYEYNQCTIAMGQFYGRG